MLDSSPINQQLEPSRSEPYGPSYTHGKNGHFFAPEAHLPGFLLKGERGNLESRIALLHQITVPDAGPLLSALYTVKYNNLDVHSRQQSDGDGRGAPTISVCHAPFS